MANWGQCACVSGIILLVLLVIMTCVLLAVSFKDINADEQVGVVRDRATGGAATKRTRRTVYAPSFFFVAH
jgi:hypothetical protein